MLAQDIRERIDVEARGIETNAFGWRFRPYILPEPRLSEFKDHAGEPVQVWVVLEEPGNGYTVVFDPEAMEFGLATGGVVVGSYGGFMAALNAM